MASAREVSQAILGGILFGVVVGGSAGWAFGATWFWFIAIGLPVLAGIGRIVDPEHSAAGKRQPHMEEISARTMAPGIAVSMMINKDPRLERIAELQRTATQHKDKKDWDSAVSSLRESERLISEAGASYPMATYLRLPMLLQQAGRFDESTAEFKRLLAGIEGRIDREFSHQGVKVRRKLAHAEKAQTYEKMALAAKREKRPELEAEFSALSEKHRAEHAKLMRQTDAADARKDAALRRKLGLKPRN